MKKLKVALVLLFTLTCSLFLFACGGKSDATFSGIEVSGAKTVFTEADTFTLGDLVVTAKFKTDDPEKATRVLTADEYTVDSAAAEAAFQLLTQKQYGSARGTYTITVNATVDGVQKSTSYTVEIGHAWNEDETECSVCGATQETVAVNDGISISTWGSTAVLTKGGESPATVVAGETYVSYGKIGTGQKITLKGKGQENAGDTSTVWFFPITGIRNGTKGVVVRNDSWIIYEGPGATFYWPNHNAGADATTGVPTDWATVNEWDIYQEGTICSTTEWTNKCDLEISWEYREDGIVVFSIANLTVGNTITRYMKVPTAVYDCVLYGECFDYEITSVTYTYNLTLEKFEMSKSPAKTVYAENTYLEINEDSSLNGVVATAYYNQETSNVQVPITTYNIYADVSVTKDVDGTPVTDTVTVDLREHALTAEMTNFRIEFGGIEIPLSITVEKSPVSGVTSNYSFVYDGVEFYSDDAAYVYDVNENDKIAILVTGSANRLSEAQAAKVGGGYDYYIAFRLIGVGQDEITSLTDGITAATGLSTAVLCAVDNGNVNVILPLKEADLAQKTITITSETSGSVTLYLELGDLVLPAVSSYIASNEAYIDEGGDVTVRYYGLTSTDGLKVFVNNSTKDFSALAADGSIVGGTVKVKGTYEGGVLTIVYTLPELDITNASARVNWTVGVFTGSDISNPLANETIGYRFEMKNAAANGYYVLDAGNNIYLTVDGHTLSVVALEAGNNLTGGTKAVRLNVQNESGTPYNLGFNVTANGITFTEGNELVINAAAVALVYGTIGNSSDRDVGAVYAVNFDVYKALELNQADGYYIELVGTEVGTSYNLLKVTETGFTPVTVDVSTLPESAKTDIAKTCITDAMFYYTYDGFVFAQIAGEKADGAHEWTYSSEKNAYYCDKCGSYHYVDADDNDTIAPGETIGAVRNAVANGLTVGFNLTGLTSDWAPAIATSDNIAVTLPNLDAFWQKPEGGVTVNFPAIGNATPDALGTLYNGAAWNVFVGVDCYVTITLSATEGVTWYKDGVKVVSYAATTYLSDGKATVSDLVKYILAAAENGTLVFAPSVNNAQASGASNLSVYAAALNQTQVLVEYNRSVGNIAADAVVTYINGELGNDSYQVAVFGDWVDVPAIRKGTCVTFYGTAASLMAEAWDNFLYEFTTNAYYTCRTDNFGWTYDGTGLGLNNPVWTPTVSVETTDWVASYVEIAKNCTWTLTINFETSGKITCTLVMTSPEGAVYTDVAVFTFKTDYVPDEIGLHFTAEDSHINILFSVTTAATDTSESAE